ncbi:hypothetical protein SLEP1_g33346 [Rubroshorea leprosula]|uniref:RING-type E3 ubiquitin transferase n=1 Tax=Rubroshorea leprosula TaxID=152421 RepID=A0AAV5KGH3_9ROSI|nr:hypothetical protein SLEP1_g33346 [Rubroshorea leprosula]
MAQSIVQLPCDGEGACMRCKATPPAEETLMCVTCVTPWHVACLAVPPPTLESTLQWSCPDCSGQPLPSAGTTAGGSSDLVAAIKAIEGDDSLTEKEKARKRQELLSGKSEGDAGGAGDKKKGKKKAEEENSILDVLGETLNCSFCMQLPERPVTTPCGHNFCLKCFQKWIGQGKSTCAKCRTQIPEKMARQPRINSALVSAIRMAKMARNNVAVGPLKVNHFIHNQDRPEKAFTTERAQKAGKANAASGKIFVTTPPDHFGPITAEYDPVRNQGVLVGEFWEDRMECRQWGVHLPHIAGIAGQAKYGAQSVALSGGYVDDEDHGEWFLYTGSGGKDLSGNKRTNKKHSFDQKFEMMNESLRISCLKGYPVRVVRSHKEKRSAYAPVEKGVRYDGIYRIEKCWRKAGKQGFKVCRYLFVRCDNEPAPWTSDENGDRPRLLPLIPELKAATDVTERKEKKFAGKTLVIERNRGGRTLRSKKNVLNCPSCPTDISDFLQNLQVNRELMDVIESLKSESEKQEPAEGSSDEETDDMEDLADSDAEIGNENSEVADTSDAMVNPAADCEPKRTTKEVNNLQPGVVECNAAPVTKRTSKRKHADNGDYDLEVVVGDKRSRKGQEAANDANESPSSTLQVQSSGGDLE